MRICHVITRLIVGGAQENTILTCRGLVEKGHDVTLIAGPETGPEGSLWNDARASGCRVFPIDSLRRAVNPIRDWQALRALRQAFCEQRPDVVHTHSSKAGILGRAAAAQARVPFVVHTIHGMSFHRAQTATTRALYRSVERWAARRTSAFVTVADAMIQQAVEAGLAPRERFTTIRSGMETQRFAPQPALRTEFRRQWRFGDDEIVVGTIARLFDHKGYDEIIEAMPEACRREDRLRFVWIGDGSRRAAYERRLDQLGLRDRVRLLGLLPPADVAGRINGLDIVLHASRWEGLPRALVQALLTEVPAISFDNDGAPEVVLDGETGVLVPLGDTNKLAEAVASLAADSDRRARMGRQGRAHCLEQFGWHKMVDDLDALYTRLRPYGGE